MKPDSLKQAWQVRGSSIHSSILIAILSLVYGCSEQSGGPDGPQGASSMRPPPPLVMIAPAVERDLTDSVEALGTTFANESVTITAKLTDTVSQVRFEDGQLVKQGDILVELTNREETALLAEAQANAEDARLQYRRLADLLTQRSIPVSQVDEAKARLSAAEARYESILARLSDRLIRAPFTGLLGFRQVSAGTLVTPTTPITTLDDIAVVKLDFTVPELLLASITSGLAIEAKSAAFADRVFKGEVRTIGSRVDPVSRAVTVRAVIDNADLALRPGMLLTVHLQSRPRRSLAIPDIALIQEGSSSFVYVVADQGVKKRTVGIGQRIDGWAEVLSGLEAGESVVVEGQIKLRDGMAVRVESSAALPPAALSTGT